MTPYSSPVPVKEGDILDGKYQVERILGLGGMGVVVAARHLQLEQRVAIKFVLPEAVFNAEAMERFAREARAAVKLRSEHVARVLDVGTMQQSGAPYMVMEYLEGSDLGDLVEQRGPLSAQDTVDFVLQAGEAIAEAHSLGIIHRDLKPKNLFVTHAVDGKPLVKVLDFGISKQTAMGSSGRDLSLTRTSAVMGSPNYMSPEQLRSAKTVDLRTDIWAIGVILYECLTGRVPFEAETVTQLTAMVLQDPPHPIQEIRKDLSAGLARVIARCLEKDPGMRYATVADLARDIEPFGSVRGVAGRIAQVTGARSRPADAPSGRVVAVTGGTSVAWGDTQLAAAPRRRAVMALSVVLGLLMVGGAGALRYGVRAAHSDAANAAAAASPPPASPPLSSSVVPVAASPAAPSAPASVVAVASSAALSLAPSSPPPVSPPPPSPPPATRPARSHGASVAPTAKVPKGAKPASGDDLPNERN